MVAVGAALLQQLAPGASPKRLNLTMSAVLALLKLRLIVTEMQMQYGYNLMAQNFMLWLTVMSKVAAGMERNPLEIVTGSATDPQVAFDADGNALVVWYQFDGTRLNAWANFYINGTGWDTAELIETDISNADRTAIAIDDDGNG